MDIDGYIAHHQPAWDRLEQLTAHAQRGVERLPATELEELVILYQRVSAHLSYARTWYGDAALVARLSRLVAASGAVIYGSRPRTLRGFGRFFASSFPAAVWQVRRFVAVSAALFFGPAVALGLWVANSRAAVEAIGPAAVRDEYVHQAFERYYRSEPAATFALHVTTNNITVAALAFAAGIAGCVLTAYLLAINGANLGVSAGLFAAAGEQPKFYGLVLPHGLLELTAVVIAGGAGLRLGWTLIHPGDRRRGAALAEDGRRAFVIVLGLIVTFMAAGTIEGFVTGHVASVVVRVAIGVVAEAAFVAYLVRRGRAATRAGFTGALDEGEDPSMALRASPSP